MVLRTRLALMASALTAVPGESFRAQIAAPRVGDVGDGWRALLLGAPPGRR